MEDWGPLANERSCNRKCLAGPGGLRGPIPDRHDPMGEVPGHQDIRWRD